ncbi:carboxypeptidase-like regulatory domain-containing protein, partial [Aquimarina litoralis]|uniref:carboxypeptidase-like regulatory domain-containing protein n=1 Tax=Aquimarina litoralis TaxID=584605 RepID=UPI001C584FE9
MKLKLVLLFISTFFINGFLFSQYEITIDAYILDSETKQPIPYVNVGFMNKGIGTVSDHNGHIFLQYDEEKVGSKSVFQLSSLGYKTIQLSSQELFKIFDKNNTISMEPSSINLEAAAITSEKRNKKIVGNVYKPNGSMGYWKDTKSLGAEIGTRIRISHKNTKLHQLQFHVLENSTDSLLVRVNVYESTRKVPGKNILAHNIYHTITNKKGIETVDLSDYNILVDDDIMVSLELVKVFGEDIEFSIAASEEGRSYLRNVSQDEWDVLKDTGMAFNMDISYPAEESKLRKREMPKDIVLYWDTSFSAEKNDPTTTIQLLQAYVKKINNATITLVPFSNHIHNPQKFIVQNGTNDRLFGTLNSMAYNGASDFESLFKEEITPDQYIVVSDGHATFGTPNPMYDVPVFYINHTPNANDNLLHEAAIQSEGYYINLTKVSLDQAITNMLHELEDNSTYQISTPEYVKGLVTSGGKPVQGCKVTVKGTLNQVFTDANGSFSINASDDDVLTFDFFEMIPQAITLDTTKNILIDLEPNHTVLDEVVVDAEKENDQEEMVIDMYGNKVKRERIGYALKTLYEEDFPESAIFLSDLIRFRFPGVRVIGFGDNAFYQVRDELTLNNTLSRFGSRNNNVTILDGLKTSTRNFIGGNEVGQPLFVVDGIPFPEPPTYLFPAQIHSISIVTGMSGSARFGEAARNGVFIINTKLR